MAAPSEARDLSECTLPDGPEWFPLKGHFFNMIGLRTADGVYFIADCLSSERIIEKHHVLFIFDVREYLATLDYVPDLTGEWFVPAHAEASRDVCPLVEANHRKVEEVAEKLLKICAEPLIFEDVLKCVFDFYSLTMD